MRKIKSELDNPIDNFYLYLIERTVGIFYILGFTPNMITTISLILGICSINNFINEAYNSSALLYLLSYYFDCMDGYMARQYNMITVFGDYYDHIKDISVTSILLYLVYMKLASFPINYMMVSLGILMSINIGCQEVYMENKKLNINNSNSISFFKKLCPAKTHDDVIKMLHYTKIFGCGTFTMVSAILVLLCNKI
jgi:phosphatidylglycerophosphate synthase